MIKPLSRLREREIGVQTYAACADSLFSSAAISARSSLFQGWKPGMKKLAQAPRTFLIIPGRT